MPVGKIKKKTDKGFGFIEVEGEKKDVFFHTSACSNIDFDSLREGDKVSFDVEKGEKGPKAKNVRVIG